MEKLYIVYPEEIGQINPNIYGHFAEHIGGVFYDGLWVGKDSKVENINGFRKEIIDKLKKINPPIIRWPGGCFAETYDWKDGIGEDRPTRINWWTNTDNRYESNQVGTHEFVELCELVGAEPYFAANITSTTPLEIRDWIDYCTSPKDSTTLAKLREKNGRPEPFNVKYWGIGNENWGGGGNMTPKTYAHEYRKYAIIAKNAYLNSILIACGPNDVNYNWTQEFMDVFQSSSKAMNGFSLHYYTSVENADDPTNFSKDEWYKMIGKSLKIEEIIERHYSIIKGYGMEDYAKLVVDEWGCWHPSGSGPSKGYNLYEQQSTIRDAMVSAATLNIFNNHCDKVMMANVAQLANNLHCLFLASGENCIATPTYHVFDMYKEHQGAKAVKTICDSKNVGSGEFDVPQISVSASQKDGYTTLTIANLSADEDANITLEPVGQNLCGEATATVLTHDNYHAHNTFESPENVTPYSEEVDILSTITIKKASIVSIKIKHN